MAKEFVLDRELGFLTPENECKYHCLSLGSCAGVTYSEQNGEPKCTGFFAHSISYDFRGSEFHTYFEKLWCVASGKPILPTPPPLQDGKQMLRYRSLHCTFKRATEKLLMVSHGFVVFELMHMVPSFKKMFYRLFLD